MRAADRLANRTTAMKGPEAVSVRPASSSRLDDDSTPMRRGAATHVLLLAGTLAATLVVYAAVRRAFFWADDILFLYDLHNGTALEFLVTPYGGHLSWFRNLVFLTLERLAGPRPGPFFRLMLATHLVNTMLVFATVRAWTG